MSSNRGFSGGSVDNDPGYTSYRNSGFSSAMRAYGSRSVGPDPDPASGTKPPPGASAMAAPAVVQLPKVDLSIRVLKFTAKWAVIICVDTTGSMSDWQIEIFDRLGLMCSELSAMLGGPVQVAIIGFGDIPKCGDPFEVTPIGSGPELLGYLVAITKKSNGGGNGIESSDLGLEFGARMVDTSDCEGVFQFIITDEAVASSTDFGMLPAWTDIRGRKVAPRPLIEVARELKAKQDTFIIVKPYGDVPELEEGQDPDFLFENSMTKQVLECWTNLFGADWIARLWDRRRVVDVINGCIAKRVGKKEEFESRLRSRHLTAGNQFGPMNVRTVLTSIASIGGSVVKPTAKSQMLLPAAAPTSQAAPPVTDADPASQAQGAAPQLPPARSVCLLPAGPSPKS